MICYKNQFQFLIDLAFPDFSFQINIALNFLRKYTVLYGLKKDLEATDHGTYGFWLFTHSKFVKSVKFPFCKWTDASR